MPELSPPADLRTRHAQRTESIKRLDQTIAQLQAEQRLQLAALALEDTDFGYRRYVSDEVALLLGLSPWTAARLLEEAELFRAFPCVHARIGDGSWSLAHADTVLDELAASGLEHTACEQVLQLVVSAQDARTPTSCGGQSGPRSCCWTWRRPAGGPRRSRPTGTCGPGTAPTAAVVRWSPARSR